MQRPRLNKYLILAMSLLNFGCYEEKPPKGFEAVIPVALNSARQGCPNLVDTYLITSAQEHNKLLKESIAGKDFSYFIIDSLVGDQAYNYALRMEKNRFIRTAQELQANAPHKYALWRESTLLINKNYSAELVAEIQKYGAVYERKGQFHSYGCAGGWVKIQQVETSVWDVKAEKNYIQQTDVWLARDKYGDLLIRTISYRHKPGWTFWAAGGAGVRLIRTNDQWTKMQKAPDTNLTTTWSEADLPKAKKPIHKISECKLLNEMINFNARLLQTKYIIELFELKPLIIEEGVCIQPPVQLGFSSANSTEGEAIMQFLKNDPIVSHVELNETRYENGKLRYIVQMSFKDLENP